MQTVINKTKQRLASGQLALGFGLSRLRTIDAATIAASCGFDWLFVDLEHSTLDVDLASQICIAALTTEVTPLVRVSSHQPHHMSRLLDGGAMGVIVPHVETPEQAQAIVTACKYPPVGHRSLFGALPQLRGASLAAADAIRLLNEEMLVIAMIESPNAVDNADLIAATPGINGLLVGTNDLAAEAGIAGQLEHADIVDAYRRVIAACHKHDKIPGMGGVYQPDMMARYIGMGMRLVLAGADLSFMTAAARQRSQTLRQLSL